MLTKTYSRVDTVAKARRRCLRKFLYYFSGGYQGKKFIAWERDYKWNAHLIWKEQLNKQAFKKLLDDGAYLEIAKRAVTLESKTNLLFSFEKIALRDAVKTVASAKKFAEGLFNYIYGNGSLENRFKDYRDMIAGLPVKQTRVLTWPVLTIFGFIADPTTHIYLKPTVTRRAAEKYKFDFNYSSKPSWQTYQSLLDFAKTVWQDTVQFKPRDLIDIQSFIWVLGSEEYPD
ncbi:MAG TPA: hypothetical protein VGO58_19790 [Chitinophagaceae bacterium]|nr:hypothetical protein [Chitinophagaceae bacterium]